VQLTERFTKTGDINATLRINVCRVFKELIRQF